MKKLDLDVIFEDNNILVVNKPNNISVTQNKTNELTLTDLVKRSYGEAEPVHRLDRNTSGIVLYAKNKESLEILLDKFKKREIEKKYICVTYGIPQKNKDTLVHYLFKDSKKNIVYIYNKHKKGHLQIITSYKILNKNLSSNLALLEVDLKTGRTHQIRAHLAYIGFPILGDRKIWNK